MLSKSDMFKESLAYKPFKYPWAVEYSVLHEKLHWIEAEIPMGDDVDDWKRGKVTDEEKEFITQILRLFTQADVSVGSNYYNHFIPKFANNEIRNMLGSFASREAVHQRAYALLNDSLGLPEGEYSAFLEYKSMSDKTGFMTDADTSSQNGVGLSLAKAVFNEGVSLFASFIMLLNFQRCGIMRGCGKIVEWSIRDESLHVLGVSKLFRSFCDEHPRVATDDFKTSIYEMAKTCVSLEDKFIDLAYQKQEIRGLTRDEVRKYIRYLTDRRLIQLGLKGIFKVKENPIPWSDHIINGPDHTNFFEASVSEYAVGGLQGDWSYPDDDLLYKATRI